MRGENSRSIDQLVQFPGSPPLARGKLKKPLLHPLLKGSPPLARGKLLNLVKYQMSTRITPACAGKTIDFSIIEECYEDHPRLRGENGGSNDKTDFSKGSPPLARGKRTIPSVSISIIRITPACAGKTFVWNIINHSFKDHPRLRGENLESLHIQNTC